MGVFDDVQARGNDLIARARTETNVREAALMVVGHMNERFEMLREALDDAIMNADPVKLAKVQQAIGAFATAATADTNALADAIVANTEPKPAPAPMPTGEHQPKPVPTADELKAAQEPPAPPTAPSAPTPAAPPAPFDSSAPPAPPPNAAPPATPAPPAPSIT